VIRILNDNWLFIVVRCLEALLLCSEAQTGGSRELSAFNVARARGVGCEMLTSVNKSSQEMLFISKHPLWELGHQVLIYQTAFGENWTYRCPLPVLTGLLKPQWTLFVWLFFSMPFHAQLETIFGFLHSRRVCVLKGRLGPCAQAFEKEAILLNKSEGWDGNKTQYRRWGL